MGTDQISVQLYSIRRELDHDAQGALGRIAGLGYRQVELYGFVDRAEEYRDLLDTHGLSAPTGHSRLTGEDLDQVFAAAQRLGVRTIFQPSSDAGIWGDRAAIESFARELGAVAARAADAGIAVGYHNHEYEFEQRVDGVAGFEILADALDDRVQLEVDTYWAEVGREPDVPALLRRLGSRVTALHLKDGPVTKDDTEQVAVGQGSIDVLPLLTAAPRALRVVELDDHTGDIFEALRISRDFLLEAEAGR